MKMFLLFLFLIPHILLSQPRTVTDIDAVYELLERVVPGHWEYFEIEVMSLDQDEQDTFEIESRNGKIVLRGTNGVAIASALHHYLKHFAHVEVSWNEPVPRLPDVLPDVPEKVRHTSPYKYRYYLNYVTFNYTMAWWDWARWEQELDWMALHGINMPLAILGQNVIWQRVYRDLGFTDEELKDFFSGPAYTAFNWMGLLDGWGGPMPQSRIDSQAELQKKILERARSLGMTPVLPAFTGRVPPAFRGKFPDAKLEQVQWSVFPEVDILAPEDPMFEQIGSSFIEELTRKYGTDHIYSADTFIEVVPPSNDPEYLSEMSRTIYQSMAVADPEAVWVMQGWMFYFKEDFWQRPQVEALLNAVPDDNMIVLDLWTENYPVWDRVNAYHGKQWIWSMVHNFGGNHSIYGKMPTLANHPARDLHDPESGRLSGIGLTMEALEHNPAIYALFLENTWTDKPIDLDRWMEGFVLRRYGQKNEAAYNAWEVLRNTGYGYEGNLNTGGPRSMITSSPTLAMPQERRSVEPYYDPADLLPAWDYMMDAVEVLSENASFQYDLVDIGRQVIANYANYLHKEYVAAWEEGEVHKLEIYSTKFLELIEDLDRLVGTQANYLLGKWIADARSHGENLEEKDLFERNARNLLTLWHGKEHTNLQDYANRHWSGLLNGFYKQRWKQFFQYAKENVDQKEKMNIGKFSQELREWEWEWIHRTNAFPDQPEGDAVAISRELYQKYYPVIKKAYHDL